MTERELNNKYFAWMYQLVCTTGYSKHSHYRKLLDHLHDIKFTYIHPMDSNRAEDGVNLRYRFAYEHSYDGALVRAYLDNGDCSVLEMLVALAVKCEDDIMEDSDIGNRTGQWFWTMIDNLGLSDMNDLAYDECYTDYVIGRLLNREYKRDGEGGLFTIKNCSRDMRSVEFWYQAMFYFSENT